MADINRTLRELVDFSILDAPERLARDYFSELIRQDITVDTYIYLIENEKSRFVSLRVLHLLRSMSIPVTFFIPDYLNMKLEEFMALTRDECTSKLKNIIESLGELVGRKEAIHQLALSLYRRPDGDYWLPFAKKSLRELKNGTDMVMYLLSFYKDLMTSKKFNLEQNGKPPFND